MIAMIEIRRITKESASDLNLKNEPFEMPGQFVPALENGRWSWHAVPYEKSKSMVFPDENYDFEEMDSRGIIFGAYEDGECIGVAIYQDFWLKHLYLYDLKVNRASRGRGIGKLLIEAGMTAARERGYTGLYVHAQDDNINACMFYLKAGFEIGGFDNRLYRGTGQAHKADIIFYKE